MGLGHAVLFAFLRISTSARVYEHPLSLDEAAGRIQSWLKREVVLLLLPWEDHVIRAIELLQAAGNAGGNLVTDAQIAALAISYKAEVHTADREFSVFRDLSTDSRWKIELALHPFQLLETTGSISSM